MADESIRTALAEWSREELVEGWIGLNTLLEASAARREVAEAKVVQLEEALRFYADPVNNWPTSDSAGQLVSNVALDNGEMARAALSPRKAPGREG